MIEIIALYNLCKRIGIAAREKGRRAIGYQLLMILFWFSGEFGAGFTFVLLLFLAFGEEGANGYLPLVYIAAMLGAGVGAWLAFKVVAGLPGLRSNKETAPNKTSNP